jgi:hypothetical protein
MCIGIMEISVQFICGTAVRNRYRNRYKDLKEREKLES